MLLPIIVAAFVGYCFYKIYNIARVHRKYAHLPGPTRHSFFFGNAQDLRAWGKKHMNFGGAALELIYQYGDVSVVWRMTKPLVMIADTNAVKTILSDIKNFKKPEERFINLANVGGTNFIGEHSIVSDYGGPIWEHKKRILDPGFKIMKLQAHIPKLYHIGVKMADHMILQQKLNGYIDFNKAIAPFTIDAISSAGFSITDDETLGKFNKGLGLLGDHWETLVKTSPLRRSKIASLIGMGPKTEKPAEKQLAYIRQQAKDIIMKRVTDGSFGSVSDLLDFIIVANQDPDTELLKMEDCLDDFMTMYEAGNVTTATTLSFVLAELVRNPQCLVKLTQEVDDVWVAQGIDEYTPVEDTVAALKAMPYLEAVINESLRHHPPVVANTRVAAVDLEVNGYHIPAGSLLSQSQYAMHHHPKHWNSPEIFNPDRFIEDKIVPYTFFPFLMGPRRCLGKNFALIEMKVFLCIWLSRFSFKMDAGRATDKIYTEQSLLCRSVDNFIIVRDREY